MSRLQYAKKLGVIFLQVYKKKSVVSCSCENVQYYLQQLHYDDAHNNSLYFTRKLPLLLWQDHTGISNAAPADCPLIPLLVDGAGTDGSDCLSIDKARIHDYILNLCFSISPTAFFQVSGALLLYKFYLILSFVFYFTCI